MGAHLRDISSFFQVRRTVPCVFYDRIIGSKRVAPLALFFLIGPYFKRQAICMGIDNDQGFPFSLVALAEEKIG